MAKLIADIRAGVQSVNPNAIVEGNTWEIPVEPADVIYQEEDAVWVEITSLPEYPGPHPTYRGLDQLLRKEGNRAATYGKPLWVQLNFPYATSWAPLTALILSNRANLFKGGHTLQSLSQEGWDRVKSYFRFATRYSAFIYESINETESIKDLPQQLSARTRTVSFNGKTYLVAHLINVGNPDNKWSQPLKVTSIKNLTLKINMNNYNVYHVYFSSPDIEDGEASTLEYNLSEGIPETTVPKLEHYGLVIIETKPVS